MKQRTPWKTVLVVSALALPFGTFAACSSQETTTDAGPSGLVTCPGTVQATNGAACNGDTLSCSFILDCGAFAQTAVCDCVGGKFKCSDRVGDIPANTAGRCKPLDQTSNGTCPSSRANALGAACTTAGQQCFYEGAVCPENTTGKPYTDVCHCDANKGDAGGFSFACDIKRCASSTTPDPLPMPQDSGTTTDAARDTGTSSDSSASPG